MRITPIFPEELKQIFQELRLKKGLFDSLSVKFSASHIVASK